MISMGIENVVSLNLLSSKISWIKNCELNSHFSNCAIYLYSYKYGLNGLVVYFFGYIMVYKECVYTFRYNRY